VLGYSLHSRVPYFQLVLKRHSCGPLKIPAPDPISSRRLGFRFAALKTVPVHLVCRYLHRKENKTGESYLFFFFLKCVR
jgi:hypothetical protein